MTFPTPMLLLRFKIYTKHRVFIGNGKHAHIDKHIFEKSKRS